MSDTPKAVFDGVEVTREDFEVYERVRGMGQFNMFMPQARLASGLSRKVYMAILKNYEALMEIYPGVRK